jgi:hypothetical protein
LALLAAVLIMLDVITIWCTCTYSFRVGSRYYDAGIGGGCARLLTVPGTWQLPSGRLRIHAWSQRAWWFDVDRLSTGGAPFAGSILVPFWVLSALVIGVIVLERRVRESQGRRAGLCTHCGYDLAGLPPEAVCPECGRARA